MIVNLYVKKVNALIETGVTRAAALLTVHPLYRGKVAALIPETDNDNA